jgi:hypothetical protein
MIDFSLKSFKSQSKLIKFLEHWACYKVSTFSTARSAPRSAYILAGAYSEIRLGGLGKIITDTAREAHRISLLPHKNFFAPPKKLYKCLNIEGTCQF